MQCPSRAVLCWLFQEHWQGKALESDSPPVPYALSLFWAISSPLTLDVVSISSSALSSTDSPGKKSPLLYIAACVLSIIYIHLYVHTHTRMHPPTNTHKVSPELSWITCETETILDRDLRPCPEVCNFLVLFLLTSYNWCKNWVNYLFKNMVTWKGSLKT